MLYHFYGEYRFSNILTIAIDGFESNLRVDLGPTKKWLHFGTDSILNSCLFWFIFIHADARVAGV